VRGAAVMTAPIRISIISYLLRLEEMESQPIPLSEFGAFGWRENRVARRFDVVALRRFEAV